MTSAGLFLRILPINLLANSDPVSMKFCSHCGHALTIGIPPLDNMPRHICPNCHMIHYENPKIVVCSIPTWETENETSILLCRRAITPRHGFWTLPGGFMENDETTEQAARRETKEEAGADVRISNLFSLMNLPVYHQVHLFYLAQLENTNFAPGEESLETRLFTEKEIPWDQLAFSTIKYVLKFYFEDRKKIQNGGNFGFHTLDLTK